MQLFHKKLISSTFNFLQKINYLKSSIKNQDEDPFEVIMNNNKRWAKEMIDQDPNYFKGLEDIQNPQYLYIGCADSRVPANQIMGLKPG